MSEKEHSQHFDSGGFADIFKLPNEKVLKAYRRKQYANRQEINQDDHDLVTLAHCRAEVRAYEILQNVDDINIYIPKYYGMVDPHNYLSGNKDKYVKNCGLILEFIPGIAKKLNFLDESIKEEAERVTSKIEELVLNVHALDASFFKPGLRAEFTLIDFSLWDSSDYECYLYENYSLSPKLRSILESESLNLNSHAKKKA